MSLLLDQNLSYRIMADAEASFLVLPVLIEKLQPLGTHGLELPEGHERLREH